MTKKHKKTKTRKEYPKEIEAAWFVLKEVIDPLACSESYNGIPLPMNKKLVLEHHFSGTKFYENISASEQVQHTLKMFYFSKSRLLQHLNRSTTYYYRCKRCSPHFTGYGSSDKQALELPFSKELGISTKKTVYNDYYVIFPGIDVDAHNNETDAEEVKNWLHRDYFQQAYWEPSTHYKGRHGYFKLAYPRCMSLTHIREVLAEVYALLDQKRIQLGYDSKIDVPCGLPVNFSYDSSITVPNVDINVLYPNYAPSSNSDIISDSNSDSYETYIEIYNKDSHEYKQLQNIKRPVSLLSSQCFKFPRFNATSLKCNMADIISFYHLRYYDFSYFVNLRDILREEMGPVDKVTPDFSSDKKNTGVLVLDQSRESENMGEERKEGGYPIVCTTSSGTEVSQDNSQNQAELINWEDINNNIIHNYTKNNGNIHYKKQSNTYDDRIDECRNFSDIVKRTNKFYWYYSIYLKYVPDEEAAINEYLRQGLNENPDINSKTRKRRFRNIRKKINAKFNLDQCGLNLDDWEDNKDRIVQYLTDNMVDIDLKYSRGKNKTLSVKVEELALIYFAIHKSNISDAAKKDDDLFKYSYSYNMIRDTMILKFGSDCKKNGGYNKNKTAKILKVLQETEMIVKVGNYIIGTRGTCYQTVKIPA